MSDDEIEVTETVQAGSGEVDPIQKQLKGLVDISEKILKGVEKKKSPNHEFRFVKIAITTVGANPFKKQFENIREQVLMIWQKDQTLDQLLRETPLSFSHVDRPARSKFMVKEIYLEAVKKSVSIEALNNAEMVYYPDIFRLHFARILNFSGSGDPRLEEEIKSLETKLRNDSVESERQAPSNTNPFGFDMSNMMANLPPQFAQFGPMAQQLMAKAPDLMKLGSVLTDPDLLAAVSRGDMKKVAKTVVKNKEVRQQVAGLGGTVNPMLKHAAKMFQKNGVPLPKEAETESNEEVTLEGMMDKLETHLDTMEDAEKGDEEAIQSYLEDEASSSVTANGDASSA